MKISVLKQEALLSIKNHLGTVLGTSGLFCLIMVLFSICLGQFTTTEGVLTIPGKVLYIVMVIILFPLAIGIANTIVKITGKDPVSPVNFITYSFKNFFKLWKILFRIMIDALIITGAAFLITLLLLMLLITTAGVAYETLQTFTLICYIIYIIALIIKIIPYYFSFFIFIEHPEKKVKEIVTESKTLLKGQTFNFVLLIFSFIGWALLFTLLTNGAYYLVSLGKLPYIVYSLTTYLPSLLLTPYILATQYAYYEDIQADNNLK